MAKITPKQIEEFKEAHAEGLSRTATAEKVGIAKSTVDRLRDAVKEGRIDEMMSRAERLAAKALAHPSGKRPNIAQRAKHFARGKKPDPPFLPKLLQYTKEGMTLKQIAEKLHITAPMVSYWKFKAGVSKLGTGRPISKGHGEDFTAQCLALKEQGYSLMEISTKLGVPRTTIDYHLHVKQRRLQLQQGGLNGTGDSSFNKSIRIGIAYAETQRFIGVLGERLGIAPELLRSRLSELLGHPPLRSQRGVED